MNPVGEPDAGNPHVRFDERGGETERLAMPQATAPLLDSTGRHVRTAAWIPGSRESTRPGMMAKEAHARYLI